MNIPFLNFDCQSRVTPSPLVSPTFEPHESYAGSARSPIGLNEFFPAIDPFDQILLEMIREGNADRYGRLTDQIKNNVKRGFFALDKGEFDRLCQALYHVLGILEKGEVVTLHHLLHAYFQNPEISIAFSGKGLKQAFLGKGYFTRIVDVLTNGKVKTLSSEMNTELSHVITQEFVELYFLSENLLAKTYTSFLQLLVKLPGELFQDSEPVGRRHVTWISKLDGTRWHFIFTLAQNDCFLEMQTRLPLESFSNCKIHLPIIPNIYWPILPIGEKNEDFEAESQNDGMQGLADFLTKILHVNHFEDVNAESFAKLIALISDGYRDYGGGFQKASDARAHKSLIWQFVNHFFSRSEKSKRVEMMTSAILNFQDKEGEKSAKMCLTMACNACLSIKPHVKTHELDQIYEVLTARTKIENPHSIFSLIQEGISEWGMSFEEVMQIQQCFAIVALGVRRPSFKKKRLHVIMTKHEGAPAIKIQEEGKSIFLPLEPCSGFNLCLELMSNRPSTVEYLEKVLDAYLPINSFDLNERSQLSDNAHYLQFFLKSLEETIRFKGFGNEPFSYILSYYLLAACQTCNPTIVSLELLLKKHVNLLEMVQDPLKKINLGYQMVNLLIYSRFEPWASSALIMYRHFQNYSPRSLPLVAWVWALAGIQSPKAYQLVMDIWKKSPPSLNQNEAYHIDMLYKFIQIDLKLSLDLYKSLCALPVANAECRYKLFLDLAEVFLNANTFSFVEYLKASFPFLKEKDLVFHLTPFRIKSDHVFSRIFTCLIEKKYYTMACSLLFILTEQKIVEPSEDPVWDTIFNKMIQIKDMPKAISLWEEGKRHCAWTRTNLSLVISLAENLFHANDSNWNIEKKEILNFICSHSKANPRITSLVDSVIKDGGKHVIAKEVPESYLAFISKIDQMKIVLNALKFEIDQGHYVQAAEGLLKIFQYPQKITIKIFRRFFSQIVENPEHLKDSNLMDVVFKILLENEFNTLFKDDKNEKVTWILRFFQILTGETTTGQFSRNQQRLFELLLRDVFSNGHMNGYPNQAIACLQTLLLFKEIPASLRKCLKLINLNLLEFSLSLPIKTMFAELVQFLINHQCLPTHAEIFLKRMNRLSLNYLKSSQVSEEILGFHHLWKDYAHKKDVAKLNPEVLEILISRLIDISQIAFAHFWTEQILKYFSGNSSIKMLLRLGVSLNQSFPAELYHLLALFYEKKWKDPQSKKAAWKVLAEDCITKKHLDPIFILIEKQGKNVIADLVEYAAVLVEPFLTSPCQSEEDLDLFFSLVQVGKLNEPLYWLDLIEKIQRNKSQRLKENFLGIFKQKIIEEDILKNDPDEKAACLLNCIPLFESLPSFDPNQWYQDSSITHFFKDERLIAQRKAFYLHLSEHKNFIHPIEKLIQHNKLKNILEGCKALVVAFENEPMCLKKEQFLLTLLKRSYNPQNAGQRQVIQEMLKVLDVYATKTDTQWVDLVMEACILHPNLVIRGKFSILKHRLLPVKGSDCFEIFCRWMELPSQDENFIKVIFEILESPQALQFLSQDQIDQTVIRWIYVCLKNKKLFAIDLFYQYFLKFEKSPKEKAECVAEAAKIILQYNEENATKFVHIKYFNAMLYLWLKQCSEDSYLEKRKHLPKEERDRFLLDVLFDCHEPGIQSNPDQLARIERIFPQPFPHFLTPIIYERIFEFTEVFFCSLCPEDLPRMYYGTFSYYLNRFSALLWDLYPYSPVPNRASYFHNVMLDLIEKLIHFDYRDFPYALNKILHTMLMKNRAPIDIERFCKIFLCVNGSFPEGAELAREKVTSIVEWAIKMLGNKPDFESKCLSILIFKNYSRILVKKNIETYFEYLDFILAQMGMEELIREIEDLLYTQGILLSPTGEVSIDESRPFFVFYDGTKKGQALCLRAFDKVFDALSNNANSNKFWKKGFNLLVGAIDDSIFEGHYNKFYSYVDKIGLSVFEMSLIGDLSQFTPLFSLLFCDLKDSPIIKLSYDEQILRLAKIDHWLNKFETSFLSEKPSEERNYPEILKRLRAGKIKDKKKALHDVESQLIKNVIKFAIHADLFTPYCRADLLRYFQDILLKRGERDFDLILDCYRLFWNLLENNGSDFSNKKETQIAYFSLVLVSNPEYSLDIFKKTQKGQELASILFNEILEVWIKSFKKVKVWNVETAHIRFQEILAFIYSALENKAFEFSNKFYAILNSILDASKAVGFSNPGEAFKLCEVFNRALVLIIKDNAPVDEPFINLMAKISGQITLMMRTLPLENEERDVLVSLLIKWTDIFYDRKAFGKALIILKKDNLKPELLERKVVGFVTIETINKK
ncbi:hypothetical protein [Parachlamydia acanthamoebae]|uniref:hypothetical protein n=1 Tax=Parachlamydia acanthamoebae TaxID=83552 RepID=UPI0024E1DFE1|nr:hypothetical protein [Parachlamydia acanthamoebae]